jgi:hypothetical protein
MLRTRVLPSTIVGNDPAQLVCTVFLPADTTSTRLVISMPAEIVPSGSLPDRTPGTSGRNAPTSLTIPIQPTPSAASYSLAFAMAPGNSARGERVIVVDLVDGPPDNPRMLQSQEVSITLRPELRLFVFLLIGGLGILIGYALRLAIRSTSRVPAPAFGQPRDDVQALGGGDGWLTRTIRNHPLAYLLVDGLVTLLLGLGAMLAMMTNDRLPDAGTTWHGTLLLGAGLGLLANSELVTRLK